jgi:hypothetical protein
MLAQPRLDQRPHRLAADDCGIATIAVLAAVDRQGAGD